MASTLLGKAGKRAFAKHLERYEPADPLYEFYTDDKGRTRQRKRELPPGLSKRDAAILKSVKRRAHHLDKGFSLCGFRFGWTFLITLIPVAGDAVVASLNYYLVVRKAKKADIPAWLVSRMVVNNALSVGVGLIPLVGDVILAVFKTNSRNAALLEEYLRIRGEEFLKMGGATMMEDVSGKKKKVKATSSKPPMTAHDVAEVKPGAGMTGAEMKAATTNPTSDAVLGSSAVPLSTSPLHSAASPARGQSSGFSLFGRSKKNKSPSSGFVENLSS